MNQFHGFLLEFGLVMSHRHAGMSQLTILLDTKKNNFRSDSFICRSVCMRIMSIRVNKLPSSSTIRW